MAMPTMLENGRFLAQHRHHYSTYMRSKGPLTTFCSRKWSRWRGSWNGFGPAAPLVDRCFGGASLSKQQAPPGADSSSDSSFCFLFLLLLVGATQACQATVAGYSTTVAGLCRSYRSCKSCKSPPSRPLSCLTKSRKPQVSQSVTRTRERHAEALALLILLPP